MKTICAIVLSACFSVAAAHADSFRPVTERTEFVSVVADRSLQISLYGIDLQVSADGKIQGKGAGRPVMGQWRWQGGFFCRDLYWGQRDLGPNCQEVRVNGDRIRFTSDRGAGRSAVFRLR